MKKTLCFVVAALLLFSLTLTGCGNEKADPGGAEKPEVGEDTGQAEKPKEATISFWYTANEADPNDRDNNWQVENIELFTKANPHIKIEKTVIGGAGGQNFRTKLVAEAASGNLPDVFMTWSGDKLAPMVRMGAVMALDDVIAGDPALKEVVNPDNLGNCTFDGKVYALPDAMDCLGVFYNKELFEQYNLTPPKNIDDLIKVSKTFKENDIIPVALGNSVKWVTQIPYTYILTDLDPALFETPKEELDFSTQVFKDAGKQLKEIVDAGVFMDNFNGVAPAESRAAFTEGKAAMHIQGTWQTRGVEKALGDKAGFIPFPTKSGQAEYMLKVLPKGYAVSAETKEKEVALAFLKFMFTEERQVAFAQNGVLLPTKNINLDAESIGPLYSEIVKTHGNYKGVESVQTLAPNVAVSEEVKSVIQNITTDADIDEQFNMLQEFNKENK